MKTPAEYNPDTLAAIRQGASARDLGWMPAFYEKVCKTHGIAAGIDQVRAAPASVSQPANDDAIRWDKRKSILSRGRGSVALPERQAGIFDYLHTAYLIDGLALHSARTLMEHLGIYTSVEVFSSIRAFNKAAKSLAISIKGTQGNFGGYRLHDHEAPKADLGGVAALPKILGSFDWNPDTRTLSRGGATVHLRGQYGLLFEFMLARQGEGHTLRTDICEHLICPSSSIGHIVVQTNLRLTKLRLQIEGRLGKPGGYRLVDLCSVASASVPTRERD